MSLKHLQGRRLNFILQLTFKQVKAICSYLQVSLGSYPGSGGTIVLLSAVAQPFQVWKPLLFFPCQLRINEATSAGWLRRFRQARCRHFHCAVCSVYTRSSLCSQESAAGKKLMGIHPPEWRTGMSQLRASQIKCGRDLSAWSGLVQLRARARLTDTHLSLIRLVPPTQSKPACVCTIHVLLKWGRCCFGVKGIHTV